MKRDVFQGIDAEKLKDLSTEEFVKVTTSRNRRTILRLKGNPRLKSFMERVRKIQISKPSKVIRTHMRDAVIIPEWIGLKFAVHNGRDFKPVDITYDKVGKRLGDFSHTTSRVLHSGPGVGATRGSKFVPLK